MGFSIAIIAIKGHHLEEVGSLFNTFDFIANGDKKTFKKWSEAGKYLFDNYFEYSDRDVALRCIWADKTWTLICDPEMVDSGDDRKLEQLSRLTHSDVWTFCIQISSGSYLFSKFAPDKQREFTVVNGKILTNEGLPLSEEMGLNINEEIFADDIISIGKNLGFNIEPSENGEFTVMHLAYNEQMKAQLAPFKQKTETRSDNSKPWWKIW